MAQLYAQNLITKQWVPVGLGAAAATVASVASSASSVVLKAANGARRGLMVFNESSAILYISYATPASLTAYTVQVAAGGYWEMPQPAYSGAVYGIWASANGNARVTETS